MGQKNIEQVFKKTARENRVALIPFITAGDPSLSQTQRLAVTLAEHGADILELGVPFSDPLADGPIIQRASERSLRKRTTLTGILASVEKIRRKTGIPIVLMSYYNPILKYGLALFVKRCSSAGVDGVIIPDLPPEEADEWIKAARPAGLATIFLAAPTSTEKRIKRIARLSRGFLYYVSLTGVTGMRKKVHQTVLEKVRLISRLSRIPVCVGFGISKPEHIRQLTGECDGIIIGSALVRFIERHYQHDLQKKIRNFIILLKKATCKP